MPTTFPSDEELQRNYYWIVVVFLWVTVTFCIYAFGGKSATSAGPFGDMFGAVNALFTGLAFSAVVATLRLQWKQILNAKQDQERLEKKEEETRQAFNKSTYAASYQAASVILQQEPTRRARRIVLVEIDATCAVSAWTEDQRKAAQRTCHTFEQLAQLVRHGLLPSELALDVWGHSLARCWPILASFVSHERAQRQDSHFWSALEALAKQAISSRVQSAA